MADNKLSADEILKYFGDYKSLRRENVICGSEDENEINLFNRTPHYVLEDLPLCLKKGRASEHIELKCAEYKLQYVKFHVICIQEIWLDDAADLSLFHIYGFNCFVQGKHCSSHGGLITSVDSRLNAAEICSINNSSICEDLLVSIYGTPHKTKVVLGSLVITTMRKLMRLYQN